jgi:hypothetical protein
MPATCTLAQAVNTCAPWLWRASFGGAGGTAGVEVGGDVGGRDVAAAHEAVVGLCRAQHVEVGHSFGQRAGRARGFVVRCHAQHGGERGHLAAQAHGLRPHARFAVRAIGDQHLGAAGVHQRDKLLVGQQRIERLHDAGRLAAPEREVVFEAARQQHRHRVMRPHAQRMQHVRGLVDAREQLGVRPADRLVGRVAGAQEGQRCFAAESRAGVAEDLVGAARPSALHRAASLRACGCR